MIFIIPEYCRHSLFREKAPQGDCSLSLVGQADRSDFRPARRKPVGLPNPDGDSQTR